MALNPLIKTIGLCAALLVCRAAFGQINESDTVALQLRASISGNFQKGNVNILVLRGQLELSTAFAKNWSFKSQNVSLYQAFLKVKADNDVLSRNYLYYKPYKRFYPFALGYVSTNFRREIAWRYFAGAGATTQLLRKPNHQIKTSAGVIYEQSKLRADRFNFERYNGSIFINQWRATTWLWGSHAFWQKRLLVYYSFYWQPSLQDRRNYRWQADAGLELPVWKGLAANAHYTYTFENVVTQGTQQADQIISFGLTYRLKHQPKTDTP